MRSSILIASYLWKDTLSRWREQPSSVLARVFVGLLLVTVAALILVTFTLLEKSLRERLSKFGLNTLVAREVITPTSADYIPNGEVPNRLSPLDEFGRMLRLRQLFTRAKSEFAGDLTIFTYGQESLPVLAEYLDANTGLVCVTDDWPEGSYVTITLNRQSGQAIVRRAGDLLQPINTADFILVPQNWSPDLDRAGYTDITLFEPLADGLPMNRFTEAIAITYSLDRQTAPQIQSALPVLRELEALQARQNQWRLAMAALLGLSLALVYGAIAVLEFRQNLYVGALLRSFGAPGKALYFRQWIENAFVANAAALVAIFFLYSVHEQLFKMFGFSSSLINLKVHNPYWSEEMVLILICVNIGAFISSLPVAFGLRRSVGQVLS
ncbi:MAG: hypothetical protein SFY81_10445 [Verrucomicrobiota bacterium]|nr:hypothetical protein [Verrucomicrobiota bacterium]